MRDTGSRAELSLTVTCYAFGIAGTLLQQTLLYYWGVGENNFGSRAHFVLLLGLETKAILPGN